MERALVIGCPGAGKSTFARTLRDKTGLPLHYLDMLWHKPDKTNFTREEFDAGLAQWLAEPRWVIDGNYLRTLEPRLRACDTVFFLDYPLETCLAGARSRVGKPREDMPWVEDEFDPEFHQWILDFAHDQRPRIMELLEQYREGREIHVFTAREAANDFLETLSGPTVTL